MCIVLIKRGSSCSRTTATTTAASASTKKKRDKKIHFNYVLIVFRVLCSFCVRFVSPINQFYPLIPTIRPSFIIKIKRHTHTHRRTEAHAYSPFIPHALSKLARIHWALELHSKTAKTTTTTKAIGKSNHCSYY